MQKEIIIIDGIKRPTSPFNHVVKAGDILFLSSQLSCDLKTGDIIPGTIKQQTQKALQNVQFLLESSGTSMDNIVKVTIFMKDVNEFNQMNQVYREFFKVGHEPTRVTIQALSPIEGIKIEIEVIAVITAKLND
ncbi:MAG: RidA family protein [Promethearchaeota archaeon]